MLLNAGPVPLYFQIQRLLRDQIAAGVLPPGALLPTEAELCTRFGVSRITAGKALNGLVTAGLAIRRRGRGSFVIDAPEAGTVIRLIGTLDEAMAPVRGLSREALLHRAVQPPTEVQRLLRLPDRQRVMLIESLYASADGPYSLTRVFVPRDIAILLGPAVMTDPRPMIDLVQDALHARIVRAEQAVDPDNADQRLAKRLGIVRGAAVLRVTRTFVVEGGRPVQVGIGWYHPRRYRYTVQLLPERAA